MSLGLGISENVINVARYGKKITLFPLGKNLSRIGIYGFIGMKVKSIRRSGSRRINKMGTIGKAGTENQDFGRTTYEYSLDGELYLYSFTDLSDVTDLADDLAVQYAIEYCYLTRTPLLLISDIDTTIVIIEKETFVEEGSRPNTLKYKLDLLEISDVSPTTRLTRKMIGTVAQTGFSTVKGTADWMNLVVF